MARRAVRETDRGLVREVMQAAYAKVAWEDRDVERWLSSDTIHMVDSTRRAYCHLTDNELDDPLGAVPAGLTSHVSTLAPQHHDQAWVEDVLGPLLARSLRAAARKWPHLLQQPVYAYLAPDLLPFWTPIFNAATEPRSSGAHVIWLPTLQEAISKVTPNA